MNYIVKISWYSGGCELLADEFFPTTIEKPESSSNSWLLTLAGMTEK